MSDKPMQRKLGDVTRTMNALGYEHGAALLERGWVVFTVREPDQAQHPQMAGEWGSDYWRRLGGLRTYDVIGLDSRVLTGLSRDEVRALAHAPLNIEVVRE